MDSKKARITRKERRLLLGNSVEGVAIYFTLLFVIEFVACTVKKKQPEKKRTTVAAATGEENRTMSQLIFNANKYNYNCDTCDCVPYYAKLRISSGKRKILFWPNAPEGYLVSVTRNNLCN